jgi:DNA transformation protein and related proteins
MAEVTGMPAKRTRDGAVEMAALPSLGLTSAQMLVEAGVSDASTLRQLGAVECYRRLRFHHGKRATINFVYALECACRGLDWRLLEPERKAELRREAKAVAAELERSASG